MDRARIGKKTVFNSLKPGINRLGIQVAAFLVAFETYDVLVSYKVTVFDEQLFIQGSCCLGWLGGIRSAIGSGRDQRGHVQPAWRCAGMDRAV